MLGDERCLWVELLVAPGRLGDLDPLAVRLTGDVTGKHLPHLLHTHQPTDHFHADRYSS